MGDVAAIALFLGSTGIGIVLVLLLLAVAVLIEYLKDNKIQEWLKRCMWGDLPSSEHYPNLDTEMRELKLATAG